MVYFDKVGVSDGVIDGTGKYTNDKIMVGDKFVKFAYP
jgi:hypothetical protein